MKILLSQVVLIIQLNSGINKRNGNVNKPLKITLVHYGH